MLELWIKTNALSGARSLDAETSSGANVQQNSENPSDNVQNIEPMIAHLSGKKQHLFRPHPTNNPIPSSLITSITVATQNPI